MQKSLLSANANGHLLVRIQVLLSASFTLTITALLPITEGRCPVSARRQGMQVGTQNGGPHRDEAPQESRSRGGCRASGAGLQARHLCSRALLPLLCPVRLQVTGLGEGSHSSPHSGCPQAQWCLPHVPTKSGVTVPASSWTAWSAMSPRVPSVDPPPTAWREGNHPSYPHALKS